MMQRSIGPACRRLYFLFEPGKDLDQALVSKAEAMGVTVVPSINMLHYDVDGNHVLLARSNQGIAISVNPVTPFENLAVIESIKATGRLGFTRPAGGTGGIRVTLCTGVVQPYKYLPACRTPKHTGTYVSIY